MTVASMGGRSGRYFSHGWSPWLGGFDAARGVGQGPWIVRTVQAHG